MSLRGHHVQPILHGIRACLLHKLINGFLLRTTCCVLPDRLPHLGEAGEEQLPALEDASPLVHVRHLACSLPRSQDSATAQAYTEVC